MSVKAICPPAENVNETVFFACFEISSSEIQETIKSLTFDENWLVMY